jgi:hypothetical protein
MKRGLCAAAGVLAFAMCGQADAQQQIEWKQTLNTPKGLSLPKDVKGELLGLELGDTYAEAKAKLQPLMAESKGAPKPSGSTLDRSSSDMMGESQNGPLTETRTVLRFQAPGGHITANYVGKIFLDRKMQGSTQQDIADSIEVRLSAPSSGHQVIGVRRRLLYFAQADQPRVSELMAALKAKYKSEPYRVSETTYRFVFNDGRPFPQNNQFQCRPQYDMTGQLDGIVSAMNPSGQCDVVLDVTFQFGISKDHIYTADMILSDNERGKLNIGADVAFFNSYVTNTQGQAKGVAPKL